MFSKKLPDSYFVELMKEVDENKDGEVLYFLFKISLEEFLKIMIIF
jgi:hypothetical protein